VLQVLWARITFVKDSAARDIVHVIIFCFPSEDVEEKALQMSKHHFSLRTSQLWYNVEPSNPLLQYPLEKTISLLLKLTKTEKKWVKWEKEHSWGGTMYHTRIPTSCHWWCLSTSKWIWPLNNTIIIRLLEKLREKILKRSNNKCWTHI